MREFLFRPGRKPFEEGPNADDGRDPGRFDLDELDERAAPDVELEARPLVLGLEELVALRRRAEGPVPRASPSHRHAEVEAPIGTPRKSLDPDEGIDRPRMTVPELRELRPANVEG